MGQRGAESVRHRVTAEMRARTLELVAAVQHAQLTSDPPLPISLAHQAPQGTPAPCGPTASGLTPLFPTSVGPTAFIANKLATDDDALAAFTASAPAGFASTSIPVPLREMLDIVARSATTGNSIVVSIAVNDTGGRSARSPAAFAQGHLLAFEVSGVDAAGHLYCLNPPTSLFQPPRQSSPAAPAPQRVLATPS